MHEMHKPKMKLLTNSAVLIGEQPHFGIANETKRILISDSSKNKQAHFLPTFIFSELFANKNCSGLPKWIL